MGFCRSSCHLQSTAFFETLFAPSPVQPRHLNGPRLTPRPWSLNRRNCPSHTLIIDLTKYVWASKCFPLSFPFFPLSFTVKLVITARFSVIIVDYSVTTLSWLMLSFRNQSDVCVRKFSVFSDVVSRPLLWCRSSSIWTPNIVLKIRFYSTEHGRRTPTVPEIET